MKSKIGSKLPFLFLILTAVLILSQPALAIDYTTPIPLPELGADTYLGEQGGLYPGGLNVPPPAYAGQLEAGSCYDPGSGKAVVIVMGMSMAQNSMDGWREFLNRPEINDDLIVVDATVGSNQQRFEQVSYWDLTYWNTVLQRLSAAGVTADQVRCVVYHNSWSGPTGGFPDYPQMLKDSFATTMGIIQDRLVNVELIIVNSRHYGGWNPQSKQPEPYAFWDSFAVKWLIADRIACEVDCGALYVWNAYQWNFWAPSTGIPNGTIWPQSHFIEDGLHLSEAGKAETGLLWHEYFSTQSWSIPWYLDAPPTPTATPAASSTPTATAVSTSTPTPSSTGPALTPTSTSSPSATPTATNTAVPEVTPTSTPFQTATATNSTVTPLPTTCHYNHCGSGGGVGGGR